MELQHGATVTLLVVAFCILLHSCYGERLLQGQHDLVHLREQNKLRQPKLSISFVKQKPHQILTNVQRCQATLLLRVYCNAVSKWGHKVTVFVQSWTFLIYRFFSNVVWMQTIISLTSSIILFFLIPPIPQPQTIQMSYSPKCNHTHTTKCIRKHQQIILSFNAVYLYVFCTEIALGHRKIVFLK